MQMNYNTACCVTPSATPRRSKRDTRTGRQHSIPLAPPTHHSPCPAYTPTHLPRQHSIPLAPPTHHPMPPTNKGGNNTLQHCQVAVTARGPTLPHCRKTPVANTAQHCPDTAARPIAGQRNSPRIGTFGQCWFGSFRQCWQCCPPHKRTPPFYACTKRCEVKPM
jgi:hypothetical protein